MRLPHVDGSDSDLRQVNKFVRRTCRDSRAVHFFVGTVPLQTRIAELSHDEPESWNIQQSKHCAGTPDIVFPSFDTESQSKASTTRAFCDAPDVDLNGRRRKADLGAGARRQQTLATTAPPMMVAVFVG